MYVDPGEEFEVETQINSGPWLKGHPEEERLRKRLSGPCPSSGCVYINGARPGQALAVHIGEIDLDPVAYVSYSDRYSALQSWFGSSTLDGHSEVVQIQDGHFTLGEGLRIPVSPMLGYVGVAPARSRPSTLLAGTWGGNMDVQETTNGSSVFLPVEVAGALLQVGDMHARQGDGEVCGSAMEAGGRVKLVCELMDRPESMTWPRIVDETHIMTVAQARPAEDALRAALTDMVLWLEADFGMSQADAFLLLGAVMEGRCTQVSNPTFSYVVKVSKRFLPGGSGGPS